LVLCGLLLSSRGIIQGNSFAKSLSIDEPSKFNSIIEKEKKNFKGHELYGKTLGVVGLGAIGSMVAQSAGALGMKLMGYDPYISIDAAWSLPKEVQKANSLEELAGSSDFISIHVPLHESTKDLISKDLLKHFKRGSKLINLSRGGIVNNDDVIDALKNEVLSCFVTDFPSLELSRRSNESSDVILLPHIGASTAEAEINCAVMAAKQVVDFLKNGNIMNSVNFPRIKLSRSTDHRLVIINKNEPGMIGKIAEFIANEKLNISDMVNKSREDIAINLN
jgi:Phosphoglycerate dehydrogenase and related dehydrogenases